MKKAKFVIVSTRQPDGGPIVLHKLCKMLDESGFDARIFLTGPLYYEKKYSFLFWTKWAVWTAMDLINTGLAKLIRSDKMENIPFFRGYVYSPVRGCKRKYLPFIDKDTIVVYPEIVYGNFRHAEKVIRWFLYHNRYDKKAYGEDDLFITFRDVFNDKELNPENKKVTINHFDLELYRQTNFGSRCGVCYVIRKGKDRDDLTDHYDGPIVDNLSEYKKVEIFNSCKFCYLYDTQTAYGSVAALCGCIPVVIPEPGKSRNDYLKNGEKGYGVAYGETQEEIDFALQTKELLIKEFKEMEANNENNIGMFLKYCCEKWGDEIDFR